jgi:hypothetical protein
MPQFLFIVAVHFKGGFSAVFQKKYKNSTSPSTVLLGKHHINDVDTTDGLSTETTRLKGQEKGAPTKRNFSKTIFGPRLTKLFMPFGSESQST